MHLKHKTLGLDVTLVDILQLHMEAFFREKRGLDGDNSISLFLPEQQGNVLRAACRAGIISDGLDEEAIGDLVPAAVLWLARKIDEVLAKTLEIPPE